jgi:hypothetical protein
VTLFKTLLVIGFSLLASCDSQTQFDRDTWLRNNDMQAQRNPRSSMVDDLLQHHLRPGLSRNAVVQLLGTPYKEGVEPRLPKGVDLPDSLLLHHMPIIKSKTQADSIRDVLDANVRDINSFYREHAQPDTLMRYPIGWSTIDPRFLVIRLNGKGKIAESWVEQS